MTIPFFTCQISYASKLKQLYLIFTFLIHISYYSCVSGQCLNDQRSLLLQLKNTLIYDSSYSTKLVQWNQSIDCCNWNGVECDNFGHVIGLELDNEKISGGIGKMSALYNFRYLENLNFAYNKFYDSQIPRELGNLTNLARLNLSNAEFRGQIPVELSQMMNLVMLDLSSSELTSDGFTIYYMLKTSKLKNLVQNLTRLEELYLDVVGFKHKGDWWKTLSLALPNLRSLSLSYCGLSGHLNSSFLQFRTLSVLHLDGNDFSGTTLDFFPNFRNLKVLSMRDCSLKGTFPAWIFQKFLFQTLSVLHLDGNDFSGTALDFFPNFRNLKVLSMRDCSLKGTFPAWIFQKFLFQTLSVLHLDGNDFSGTALDFFPNFKNLTILSLRYCSLEGAFPAWIFQVPTLQYLYLSSNHKLGGTIPKFSPGGLPTDPSINLSNLSIIDISDCNFSGPIPFTIGNLSKLVSLNFANNHFTGSVPSFSQSNKLEYIDLRHNNLNGPLLPTHFEGFSNLQELYLSGNSLTGNIPTSLFILPSLQTLDLSHNKFSGQVNKFATLRLTHLDISLNFFNGTIQLEDFRTLQNLEFLDLSDNHLSVHVSNGNSFQGQLSYLNLTSCNLSRFPNLRNQIKMKTLDLSDNKISGDIPNWIWEIGNGSLSYLNLSNNFLTNLQTPYQISSSLDYLDLHSNMLHGELPLHGRGYMDYSNNHFHGHIPNDMEDCIDGCNTFFFSVANNSLTGEIPISICNAFSFELINLSDNLLSGVLPPCMVQNITSLRVLNIARNNISGYIPDTFPIDCQLSTLDLSKNNLRGNIPPSLRNCESLQVLNVASNRLDGTFPCNLMNFSSLHVLVLRSNKFFGDTKCHGFVHNWSSLQIIDIAFNSFADFVDPGFISSLTGMKHGNSPRLAGEPLASRSDIDSLYYRDAVTLTFKGKELKIVKILTTLTSIDFSNNKFRGAIPETFGELSSLYALNLSHNSFTRKIPKSLGNLANLESLGLAANQLTGNIPTELVSLTFLSFFDVSYNELVGRIPSGLQFGTFSAESYEGNLGLCGSPLNQSCCDSSVPTKASTTRTSEKDVDWLFMLAGLGYAVGVALVVLPPLFSRRWGDRWEELQVKFIQLIFPAYRAS